MRKSLLLSLLVLLLTALCILSVGASDKVVYLSSGATGTGASASDPVGTLAAAYAALGDEGGTLVFMKEYALGAKIDLPAHTGKILWTGTHGGTDYRESGAALKFTASVRIGFGGPTEIDNFIFKDAGKGGVLAANFHDLTVGEHVQTLDGTGAVAAKIAIVGGANNIAITPLASGAESTVTVKSGAFVTLVGFSRMVNNASNLGTVHLNLCGSASVTTCLLGASGTASKGGTTVLTMEDSASITTLNLANSSTSVQTNGTVTVNALDNTSIGSIGYCNAAYFATEGARILTYDATASLPVGFADCFDTVTANGGTVEPEPTVYEVVYVKDGGTGNGAAPNRPCGSLAAAQALLPSGGTIVLVGEVTLSAKCTLPAHTGTITYTSVYDGVDYRQSGARLYFPNGITVLLGGETVWKDISIHTDTYSYITAGFRPLTFDTGVTTTWTEETDTKPAEHVNGLRLAGGYNNYSVGEVEEDSDPVITLKSGFFRHVHAFSRYTGKTTYTGTATVTVEGTATVNKLFAGACANSATAKNAKVTVGDDAVIYNLFLGGSDKTALLTGRFDLVLYGGNIYEIDALFYYTAKDCIKTLTYDVNTVPEGFPYLAEMAQFNVVQTFCERDDTHRYSDPYASEFDASILLKRCSICGDIQMVGDLPEAVEGNYVFVAEGGLGDGTHPSIPTSDLYTAFDRLKESGGTIVLMNAYTLDTNTTQKFGGDPSFFQEPLHAGAITVTSVYGETDYREKGAKLVFDGDVDYKLGGKTTFDRIVFDATAKTTQNEIVARYFPVVFGEDVEMLRDMDDSYKLNIIGGYKHFRYTDFTDVVIEDGLIEMVTPARSIDINPETGDYTIDDPVNVISNGTTYAGFLREAAANAFNTMFADMVEDGVTAPTHIGYAWRGFLEQYDGYTRQLGNIRVNYGYTFAQSHKAVIESCSIPGASEHHLGYAFDFHDAIYDPNGHGQYDKTEGWDWIMRNGYKYGIILRFTPKDVATTGFIYEAWHFRYVGVEHATAIAKLNSNGDPVTNNDMLLTPEWCLEDYAGLVLGMYDLDSSVTVNGGTFASIVGGSVGCDDLPLTGKANVSVGEGATVKPTGKTYDLVFFSAGAEGDGLSASSPVGTLAQAYAKLGEDGGTLVWMNEFSVGAALELPAHTGTVTITSVYDGVDYRTLGAALKYTAAIRVAVNGPTVFDSFRFIGFDGGCLLCANFHPLTLGENVVTVNTNGETKPLITLIGGGNNNLAVGTLDTGETNTVTVLSGAYVHIVAFSGYNTNLSHTGTVYLNVGGDTAANAVILGAKANGSQGGSAVLTLSDDATVGTLLLGNHTTTAKMNGTVTVYAKDNCSVTTIERYGDAYFVKEEPRTLYYEETASLPTPLTTYFGRIILLDGIERTGDANGDGTLTLTDAIRALRASTDPTVEISMAADLNEDGTITVVDALLLIRSILNS